MRRLILRPGAVGDCILALPAIEHLVVEYTEVWITTEVVPLLRSAQIVKGLSATGIDLVGIGDRPVPANLAQHLAGFDSIVSWYGGNRDEFRAALTAINPRCQFLRALPPPEYAGHTTSFFCEQVGAIDALPRITLPHSPPRDAIVMHPFSGGRHKNWPLASYRELSTRVPFSFDWSAGPEEELAEAQRFNNLLELAKWIAEAKLYVGNDSGITHLAAAVGVRTLALFGPTDPAKWAPRGENVTILRHEPINELTVEQVEQVVTRLLS